MIQTFDCERDYYKAYASMSAMKLNSDPFRENIEDDVEDDTLGRVQELENRIGTIDTNMGTMMAMMTEMQNSMAQFQTQIQAMVQ